METSAPHLQVSWVQVRLDHKVKGRARSCMGTSLPLSPDTPLLMTCPAPRMNRWSNSLLPIYHVSQRVVSLQDLSSRSLQNRPRSIYPGTPCRCFPLTHKGFSGHVLPACFCACTCFSGSFFSSQGQVPWARKVSAPRVLTWLIT